MSVVVIGGSTGIGREIAAFYAVERGCEVILTSRDPARAKGAAEEIGGRARGIDLDLSRPEEIADRLRDLGRVDHLVLSAIERDRNTVRDYDLAAALRLVTLKLVGYTEVVHALADRMGEGSSGVALGGLAMRRPYPGSTTVTTVNGGVSALVRTLAVELAPVRFNAVHPALVGDSPYWADLPQVREAARSRTPTGRLTTMRDVVEAVVFLLENRSMNGADLNLDAGALLV